MARYFFDLYECGDSCKDREGQELQDLAAAQVIALKAARDIMREEVAQGKLCLGCYILVRDESLDVVHRVLFREAVQLTGL